MEQIAIYLRLSKEDEFVKDESNSITNQRAFIRGFINKNKELRKMRWLSLWMMAILVKIWTARICRECCRETNYTLKKIKINRTIREKEYTFEITAAFCNECGGEMG